MDYGVANAGTPVTLTVHDGALVQTPVATSAVWNLRFDDVPLRSGGGEDDDDGPRGSTPGPLVPPGTYRVRLVSANGTQAQRVVVRSDPRVTTSAAERAVWTSFHRRVASGGGPARDSRRPAPFTGALSA